MTPQVVGTWNLHRATLHLPLSFFLMFSSIASLVGNVAQSSYAGANLFMDSFASYRRSLNLPATTINWGVIANVGYIARNMDYFSEMLDSKGILSVRPAEAFRAIRYLLFSHARKVGDDQLPAQVSCNSIVCYHVHAYIFLLLFSFNRVGWNHTRRFHAMGRG